MSIEHETSPLGENHIPYNWSFADATARNAAGSYTGQLGKFARQTDEESIWMLVSTTPSWIEVSGILRNGSIAFTANQSMGGFKLTNLGTPTVSTDAATKAYVDAVASGVIDFKNSVRVATTANITLSGLQTIDGVSVGADDPVLVKNQSSAADNGLYLAKSGAWVRRSDADTSAEVTAGMFVFVTEGSTNADSGWVLSTDDPITLGSTGLTFVQFSGAGQIIAGAALSRTGNQLDVNVDGVTIDVNSDALRLMPTVGNDHTWSGKQTYQKATVHSPVTLVDAATIATDAALGNRFRVTLGGNRTLGNPSNPTDGQQAVWELIQDGTGSRTLALDTKFALGTDLVTITLTTTANKRDFLTAVYNSGTDKWYVIGFLKGY